MLVSNVRSCCGLHLRIDPHPSLPLIYTQHGTMVGAMFHGICKVCNAKYYYSYKEIYNNNGNVWIYNSPHNDEFLQVSSCTVLEKLLYITNNIVFGACTFESRAEMYHANNEVGDQQSLSNFQTH